MDRDYTTGHSNPLPPTVIIDEGVCPDDGGIFRASQPGISIETALDQMEGAIMQPPAAVDAPRDVWRDRHEQRFLESLALVAEAAKSSIFGDTSAWGFHYVAPVVSHLDEEAAVEAIHALAEADHVVAEDEAHRQLPPVSRDAGPIRLEWSDTIADKVARRYAYSKATGEPARRGEDAFIRTVRWPKEAFETLQGIFAACGIDEPLEGEEPLSPSDPRWPALVGEKWRPHLQRLIERDDEEGTRGLVAAYLDAERALDEIDAALGSGLFAGLTPRQRTPLTLDPPVAWTRPETLGGWNSAGTPLLGIEQSAYDAAMEANVAVDAPDPVDVAFDIVAGDYLARAVTRAKDLTQVTEGLFADEQRPVEVLMKLLANILDDAGVDAPEPWARSRQQWALRDMLRAIADDTELWRLLERRLPPRR